jgi:hypothetical protein
MEKIVFIATANTQAKYLVVTASNFPNHFFTHLIVRC